MARCLERGHSCSGFLAIAAGGLDDRLLIVSFGIDLRLHPAPEPLLAPPENATGNSMVER